MLTVVNKAVTLVSDNEPHISNGNFKPKPGDRVQVNLDSDIFEAMQQINGEWHPMLAKVSICSTLLLQPIQFKMTEFGNMYDLNS